MIDSNTLPWWNWALQIVGLSGSFLGALLNTRLDIRCFYVWRVSTFALLVIHAVSGLWVLCCLDIIYFILNFTGKKHWERNSVGRQF